MLGIKHDRQGFLLVQTQVDPGVVPVAPDDLGANDVRSMDHLIFVIIHHQCRRLLQSDSGNEDQADPMVNEPVRNLGFSRPEVLRYNLTLLEPCVQALTARLRLAIDPQKRSAIP